MGLNFGSAIFAGDPLYNDGTVNIYDKGNFIANSAFSWSGNGTPAGSITNVYDQNNTTYFQFQTYTKLAGYLQWDFETQKTFTTIYIYYWHQSAGVGGGSYQRFQGSNNGTDWTNLVSQEANSDGNEHYYNLVVTNVSYRYYRFYDQAAASCTHDTRMYYIFGILK
jgi:hypothetical protein